MMSKLKNKLQTFYKRFTSKISIEFIQQFSFLLIYVGLFVGCAAILFFFIGEEFTWHIDEIKPDKIGQFGDLIGGVVGSIWALAGVLLFYAAFIKQIEALDDQKIATQASLEAITLQINELELQRKEIVETRQVLKEQENTLKIQQFETTFFNLLNLYNSIIENMDWHFTDRVQTKASSDKSPAEYQSLERVRTGRDIFYYIKQNMDEKIKFIHHTNFRSVDALVSAMFYNNTTDLEPYYNLMKQIINKIDNCLFENKNEYVQIFASQITNIEKDLINYFNDARLLDSEFISLLQKYKIIDTKTKVDEHH